MIAAAFGLGACSARPSFEPGEECELNTDCLTPFVCRLGRCRIECRASRDCGPELACVRDEHELGVCQLQEETNCQRPSDCPAGLVCHFRQCTNECATDRDCPPGAHCRSDEGVLGCRDESMMECELHSECGGELICGVDKRCRVPCRTDWDCSDGRSCLVDRAEPICGWPEADAGAGDAGAHDAGAGDGSIDDGGSDAGLLLPPPPSAPTLAAGLHSTCAAAAGSTPHCWGENTAGQLGDGTMMMSAVPVPVAELASASFLDVGHLHACARTPTGALCWGSNSDGQLGTDSTEPSSIPTPIAGLPSGEVKDLALGGAHTCAIVDAALYCWGNNSNGELGVGDSEPRLLPTLVSELPAAPVNIESYSQHTCAVLADGRLACFGNNAEGQIGNGNTEPARSPFVAPLDAVIDVATGSQHTCALRRDGSVWCWGDNSVGQIGDGTQGSELALTPTRTTLDRPALEITAGAAHTCARTEEGLYCWGDNFRSQTGQDSDTRIIAAPTRVPGLGALETITAGAYHTCVRVRDEEHRCFGGNSTGQLGHGTIGGESHEPVEVMPW